VSTLSARTLAAGSLLFFAALIATQAAQAPAARAGAPLTLLSREGRRALPVTMAGGSEMVSLTDLSGVFQLSVHEDRLAGGLIVSYKNQTIALTPGQTLASVNSRLVSLPAAPVRDGRTWLVPVEFINRALAPIHATRIELRKDSRLVIVGDVRVPRIAISQEMVAVGSRLMMDVSPKAGYKVVSDPGRLTVTFEADALDVRLPVLKASTVFTGLSVVEPSSIAIALSSSFGTYRVTDVPNRDAAVRVVIDLLPAGETTTAAAGSPRPAPDAPAPPTLDLPSSTPALRTIVIDPGHGGGDTGAKGPGGTLEKTVTLSVARKLKAAIESRLGVRVLLTRDSDEQVRLDERAALANNNKADLFLSLHANTSFRPSLEGAEVYYLSLDEYGDEAKRLALEPSDVLPVFGGGSRPIDIVQWDMAQVRHTERASAFAQIVDEELRQRVPMSPRGLQRAPLRVLIGANMPAVLVEMGFVTNPQQERQLVADEFQNRVVQGLYAAIVRFRDAPTAPPGPVAAAGTEQASPTATTPAPAPHQERPR
jgi:N-acetylmuramoyl-L-alanine amidase